MNSGTYTPTQSLRGILASHPDLLTTLSRFGIPLGFGDKSVENVCREADVDCTTFLAVISILTGHLPNAAAEEISLPTLLGYLRNSHRYFLNFALPRVRRDLIEAISGEGSGELSMMILKFYDDFVVEVDRHMTEEEREIFVPVGTMIEGRAVPGFSIESFSTGHRPMDSKLRELKEIFVCHYHGDTPSRADLLNSVLLDIINCGNEIAAHARVEDMLLVPAVRGIEDNLEPGHAGASAAAVEGDTQTLTPREKEIVAAIAHGLGNKQIADRLCVSVHTVTTHRRNICAKLDIHSPAGLTIYALIHGIISIDEIRP